MNAPLLPDILLRPEASPQLDLPLAADGVQRLLWEGRFGKMLLEVRNGQIFVNGSLVDPADRRGETAVGSP